jgi:hypothetical protein
MLGRRSTLDEAVGETSAGLSGFAASLKQAVPSLTMK